jgi:ribose transport system ATP-binding protein
MEKNFYETIELMEIRPAKFNGSEIDCVPVIFNKNSMFKVEVEDADYLDMVPGDTVEIHGKATRGNIAHFMKNKVAMLPSNRKENSVIPDMTILENCQIAEHTLSFRKPVIHKKDEVEKFSVLKQMLRIKSDSHDDPINSLSGGNQQKVFLARWLNTDADILIFDNPTQGVDVGAKAEIYQLILQFAREGKTVIINTLEIPEIKKVSDRCVVLYDGTVAKIFSHEEINEQSVMMYSTNAVAAAGKSEV